MNSILNYKTSDIRLVHDFLGLAEQVFELRKHNINSKEEDELMDKMDVLWYSMSDYERLKVEEALKIW